MESVGLEKATLYDRYRFPYARKAVNDLLQHIGPVQTVADVGAGTGQLAKLFAERCRRVWAVEPDESMRAVGRAALSRWPSVHFVGATAEETTLATNSVDLIVIGNAFHRFKPRACQELHRVLRAEGWAAIFSYSFTDQAFTDTLFSRLSSLENVASRIEESWHGMSGDCLFGVAPTNTLTYTQSLTEDWKAFFGSARAGIEAPERGNSDFARFEQINREVFEALSTNGRITIRYETRVQFGQPHSYGGGKQGPSGQAAR